MCFCTAHAAGASGAEECSARMRGGNFSVIGAEMAHSAPSLRRFVSETRENSDERPVQRIVVTGKRSDIDRLVQAFESMKPFESSMRSRLRLYFLRDRVKKRPPGARRAFGVPIGHGLPEGTLALDKLCIQYSMGRSEMRSKPVDGQNNCAASVMTIPETALSA